MFFLTRERLGPAEISRGWFLKLACWRATVAVLLCLVGSACRPAARADVLFDSRVPVADLEQRLTALHGSLSLAKEPKQVPDFLRFTSGKRYAFAIRRNGILRAAPMPSDEGGNPYSAAALADGEPVLTAGGLIVIHAGGEVEKIVADAESVEYCPTTESLHHLVRVLEQAGISPDRVRIDNRPRFCISDIPVRAPLMAGRPGSRDYGDVMVEIDRRFTRLGEAIAARRADRADYELFGLLRSVRDDLPQARPPEDASADRLEPFARRLVDTDFPFLRQAVWDEDWSRVREGYEKMAATCNACHAAGGIAFLRIGGR